MGSLTRLLRAAAIGIVLGACVGLAIYWAKSTERIREVRARVLPTLEQSLHVDGFKLGDPAFIRIFKEERELEVWLKPVNESQFRRWRTWPVIGMSGKLGPKLNEGDGQAPEGFYAVDSKAMNPLSDFHLSFNVGYPNEFDRAQGRTGSFIMVHGKRASIGCFAMGDAGIEPIYLVVESALSFGQPSVPIHIFPFRMTDERMAKVGEVQAPWLGFWQNLREGYDRLEREHVPPLVKAEGSRYTF